LVKAVTVAIRCCAIFAIGTLNTLSIQGFGLKVRPLLKNRGLFSILILLFFFTQSCTNNFIKQTITKKIMKFYLSTAFILVMAATALHAQHVNIGVKGGLNLYTISSESDINYDMKAGFHAGLVGHIHFTKHFALQPEITYSTEGAKYSFLNIPYTLNLNYVNVPILFQYMFDNGFRLEAGPQVGFLVSAKSETNNTKTDVKNNFKKIDFALGAGIGYVHTPSGWGADARYNFGMGNINDNSSVKYMNQGFQFGLFYLFNHR
jgi:Outer membrane protein beta-barrel domain